MYKILFLLALCTALGVGCKGHSATKQTAKTLAEKADTLRRFEYIKVPDSLTAPGQKTQYVARHFWDNYDFADTTLLSLPQVSEQGFADYLDLLSALDTTLAKESMRMFVGKAFAVPPARKHFLRLSEKYLYDPNSPYRNEELYITILQSYLSNAGVSEDSRIRPRMHLEKLLKNRAGTRAADFRYETAQGDRGHLHGINSSFTLIYFNNPECHNCKTVTSQLMGSAAIDRMIAGGQLTILSLYPDAQVEMWRSHTSEFPDSWIVAYDKGRTIDTGHLYDLRAIPSLYLLDKDKKVLLKDADFPQVEAYLKQYNLKK